MAESEQVASPQTATLCVAALEAGSGRAKAGLAQGAARHQVRPALPLHARGPAWLGPAPASISQSLSPVQHPLLLAFFLLPPLLPSLLFRHRIKALQLAAFLGWAHWLAAKKRRRRKARRAAEAMRKATLFKVRVFVCLIMSYLGQLLLYLFSFYVWRGLCLCLSPARIPLMGCRADPWSLKICVTPWGHCSSHPQLSAGPAQLIRTVPHVHTCCRCLMAGCVLCTPTTAPRPSSCAPRCTSARWGHVLGPMSAPRCLPPPCAQPCPSTSVGCKLLACYVM